MLLYLFIILAYVDITGLKLWKVNYTAAAFNGVELSIFAYGTEIMNSQKEHTSRGLNFCKPQMSNWQLDAVINPDVTAGTISSLKLKMGPMAPKPHDCDYTRKHLELGTVVRRSKWSWGGIMGQSMSIEDSFLVSGGRLHLHSLRTETSGWSLCRVCAFFHSL